MNAYKVTFSNGDSLISSMNATLQEATEYYTTNWFNFGDNDWGQKDIMVKGVKVEAV